MTEAVTEALRSAVEARLDEQLQAGRQARLHEILERCAQRPADTSGPSLWEINESLWDEAGLPRCSSTRQRSSHSSPAGDDDADLERVLDQASIRRISAANYFEAGIVMDGRGDPVLSRLLDDVITSARIVVEPVTAEQADVAGRAYRDFGRGSGHPARFNFGDCFAYALAITADEELLFKDDDFFHTDVRPAWRPRPV